MYVQKGLKWGFFRGFKAILVNFIYHAVWQNFFANSLWGKDLRDCPGLFVFAKLHDDLHTDMRFLRKPLDGGNTRF